MSTILKTNTQHLNNYLCVLILKTNTQHLNNYLGLLI